MIVLDPSLEEEMISNGIVVIAVNVYGDICFIHKPGNSIMNMKLLLKLIAFCEKKSKDIGNSFRKFIEEKSIGFKENFEGENFF